MSQPSKPVCVGDRVKFQNMSVRPIKSIMKQVEGFVLAKKKNGGGTVRMAFATLPNGKKVYRIAPKKKSSLVCKKRISLRKRLSRKKKASAKKKSSGKKKRSGTKKKISKK